MAIPNFTRTLPRFLPFLFVTCAGVLSVAPVFADPDAPARALTLRTPLGQGALVLISFNGTEEMSRLFRFELDMVSELSAVSPSDIVGRKVTFGVERSDGSPRYFNGFVSRFAAGDEDETGRRSYRAEVVPWLWFLTRTTDCRIFQDKTVPEIIGEVVGELGFADLRSDLTRTYPKRECCVQYRESDFNFISRLMEHEGIFYYFIHDDGMHTMVLADSSAGLAPAAGCEALPYEPPVRGLPGSEPLPFHNQITSWEHRYEFRSGKIAQTDYNFKTPTANLLTTATTIVELPGIQKYERYDYPGLYADREEGQVLTDVRMEEEEARYEVVSGETNCRGFAPGHKFVISSHPSPDEEGETYVITSVRHSASEPASYESGNGPDPDVYSNRFTCIPSGVVFRPERSTPKPVIPGVQTAVVVGPRGEDIHTDRYGRVKVQFHWDREGQSDENSSCWIRVAQDWTRRYVTPAVVPRVGWEVVVSFLEGDPDRPLVTGRVFNAEDGVYVGDDIRIGIGALRRRRR